MRCARRGRGRTGTGRCRRTGPGPGADWSVGVMAAVNPVAGSVTGAGEWVARGTTQAACVDHPGGGVSVYTCPGAGIGGTGGGAACAGSGLRCSTSTSSARTRATTAPMIDPPEPGRDGAEPVGGAFDRCRRPGLPLTGLRWGSGGWSFPDEDDLLVFGDDHALHPAVVGGGLRADRVPVRGRLLRDKFDGFGADVQARQRGGEPTDGDFRGGAEVDQRFRPFRGAFVEFDGAGQGERPSVGG